MQAIYEKTENRSVASSESDQTTGCPVCGGPIQFVERRGPGEVSVAPCGHDITDVQATALAMPEQRVATDGGTDQPTCEVTEADEHCGDVKIVVDDGGDLLAMCWECRRRFNFDRVIDEDPDRAMTDGGVDVQLTADGDDVPVGIDADLYAYVRNGATAVVWSFRATSAGVVQVGEFHVHRADDHTAGVTHRELEHGTSITEFVRQYATENADRALEDARESFGCEAAGGNTEVGA